MPAVASVAPLPVTGTVHIVRMIGDRRGYRFDPAELHVAPGDGVRFEVVSGGPHNASFDRAAAGAMAEQLEANMPSPEAALTTPFLVRPGESHVISFAGIAPGTYPFRCAPHVALGMRGRIVVDPPR